MLQNPFYKGMQREAEAILERHLKKAHHLRELDDVGGQHVGVPNLDPKQGPILGRKDLTIQRFDPTRAHDLNILYNSPQILKATRVSNFINFTLALIQGERRFPRGNLVNHHSQTIRLATSPP